MDITARNTGRIFYLFLTLVQINIIFSDIVRILYLSCNVKTAKLSKMSRNKRRSNSVL